MAGAARKTSKRSGGEKRRNSTATDAVSLLKADHRQVEQWFAQFEKTDSIPNKQEIAKKICTALKVHTTIEEDIFYPAFLEATDDKDIHHEAEVEHEGAKKLIAEIEAGGSEDDYFEAKITVLSEMIKHHVNEEEQRGGMFAKARQSNMDMEALGERLQRRKDEVMAEEQDPPARPTPGRRSRISALVRRST